MVTFSVSANGIEPLSYQWSFNGAVIPGATGRSLIIVDAQMKDAGVYAVKVNNRAGSVTSAPATLDVEDRRGGTVLFANITVHAPVFDSDGQTRLEGASYLAQLYAGSSEEALAPVGGAVPFLAGAAAGYWSPSIRYLPLTSPGQNALVQVRVWDSSTAPTFELASLAGSKLVVSKIISVTTGGFGSPPSLPGLLTGLESLRLRPAIRQAQFANTGHPLGDGGRLMTLITPTDSQFTVEASTNLADWKTLFNASSENGRIQLLDSSSANFEHRFYRARLSAP